MSKYPIDDNSAVAQSSAEQGWLVAVQPRLSGWLQAAAAATSTIERNPADAAAYCERGKVYRNLQQYEQAIADYTQAMTLDASSIEASKGWSVSYTCNFAMIQGRMQQYDAAAASFGSALTLDPDDATIHYLRGVCYIELRQYDAAIADFSAALELDLNYAAAYSKRGCLRVSRCEYAAGIADLDTALELDPGDSVASSSRAAALRAAAKYDDATADRHHRRELRKEG